MLAFFTKFASLFEWGAKFLERWQRRQELDQARRDGKNEQILKDMAHERNIETRFDKAQGAIDEASRSVSNDTTRDRLRNGKF